MVARVVLTRLSAASIPTRRASAPARSLRCLNPPFGGIYSDDDGTPWLRLRLDVLTRLSAASIPTVKQTVVEKGFCLS